MRTIACLLLYLMALTGLYGATGGGGGVTLINVTNIIVNSVVHTNVTWVAKNGDDTTGTPGNFARPFLTVSNAVEASLAGSTVVVEPGTYNESVNLKDRVNLYLKQGADIAYTAGGSLVTITDNGVNVTNTIDGFGTIRRFGIASGRCLSLLADSKVTVRCKLIETSGTTQQAVYAAGTSQLDLYAHILSGAKGIVMDTDGLGYVRFYGTIYSTNDYGILDSGTGSNYFSGSVYSRLNSAVSPSSGGHIFIENSSLTSSNLYALEVSGGSVEVKDSRLESLRAVNGSGNAISKYGGTEMILDNVQLISGENNVYSIDNQGNGSHGSIFIRNPIWANTPIRPGMNVVSNGFTRLSRYLSITTNDYVFPATQGAFDTFLKNDGSGGLNWSSNLSLLVVTNMEVVNNTVLSNVTVKGDLIITNITMGGSSLRTNQYTTNISGTPVIGSFWFNGTNGIANTNGARVGLEYWPMRQSLRMGIVGGNVNLAGSGFGVGSNLWDTTNIGVGSVGFGTNVLAGGYFSSVLGGHENYIGTNAIYSTIAGGSVNYFEGPGTLTNCFIGAGSANTIKTNAGSSSIVGGDNNSILKNAQWSFIGGGRLNFARSNYNTIGGGVASDVFDLYGTVVGGNGNQAKVGQAITVGGGEANQAYGHGAVIAGGRNNTIHGDTSNGEYSTISGGLGNKIGSSNIRAIGAFIGGGTNNLINQQAHFGIITAGRSNLIDSSGTFSIIDGGSQNLISTSVDFGGIFGGQFNRLDADYSTVLGGTSNYVTVANATAIGNFVTNSVTKSVAFGYGTEGGNNRHAFVTTNGLAVRNYASFATVGGTYLITNTPIASAGSAETNLQVVTVGAHVLTNANDRLLVRGSGRFAATSNTKQVQLVYGSEDVFDSGAFVANTGAWTLDCEIIRTGNTSQSCNCSFNGGTNVVYVRTSSLDLAQTNGIATVLKITGTASGNGDITNRTLTVEWRPST